MDEELYKRHRPTLFKGVRGQDAAVRMLDTLVREKKVPHTLLFVGASGCGKTTLARILASKVGCDGADLTEINSADFRGIDMVRDIRQRMQLGALAGPGRPRVWVVDECHKLSGDAQNAFLKILEDTPGHVYFFLCTTDPHKLIRTIVTRCTEVKVSPLPQEQLVGLLAEVAGKEGVEVGEEVLERIADTAEGSARKALVILHQVLGLGDDEERLAAVNAAESRVVALHLAKVLLNPRSRWPDVAKVLKTIEEDPETVRYVVLGYARSVMLGGGKLAPLAFRVINSFRDNFYDGKQAALAAACYEVILGGG